MRPSRIGSKRIPTVKIDKRGWTYLESPQQDLVHGHEDHHDERGRALGDQVSDTKLQSENVVRVLSAGTRLPRRIRVLGGRHREGRESPRRSVVVSSW
jgi:hypothetical protein